MTTDFNVSVQKDTMFFKQILTSKSIRGTSIRTPTTVARAAPELSPKSITDKTIMLITSLKCVNL